MRVLDLWWTRFVDDGALRGWRIRMKKFSRAVLWGCTLTLVTGGREDCGGMRIARERGMVIWTSVCTWYRLGAQSIGG